MHRLSWISLEGAFCMRTLDPALQAELKPPNIGRHRSYTANTIQCIQHVTGRFHEKAATREGVCADRLTCTRVLTASTLAAAEMPRSPMAAWASIAGCNSQKARQLV